MRNLADGFGKIRSLAIRSGTALGALILLALALILTADVLTTRILDHPIPGVIKLSEAGLVLILFLGLAVATRNRGHIRVDILVARLAPRARWFCDATGYLFAAAFFAVWTWQMWYLTAKSWAIREMATGLLPYPLYPIKFLLFLGLLIATIESIHLLVLSLHRIYNPNASDTQG
jgi:TRAP-type C4-dicarboxylate transport system permease small subunit